MGTIRVHEFMTLDGVIDAPTWTMDFGFDPKMGQAIAKVMDGCEAILLGRNTYEMFEPAWSKRTVAEDPGAPFMNDTAKYLVSSTLQTPTWQNSTILGPYDPGSIRRLKESVAGGIYVSGSATLLSGLITDGLIDEAHLFVFPVTLGVGQRRFAQMASAAKWSLANSEIYDNGVLYLSYRYESPATPAD